MKKRVWAWVLCVLLASQLVGHALAEILIVGAIEPYTNTLIRTEFDEQATAWQGQLTKPGIELEAQIASLRAELMYDVRKAILDEIAYEEGFGIPGIYYAVPDEAGVIVAVILNDSDVVEFGPVPGTFLQSNIKTLLIFASTSLVTLLGLFLLWQVYKTHFKRVLEIADMSPGMPERKGSAPVIDRLSMRVVDLSQRVHDLQVETSENINNQRDFLHGVAHEFRAPLARLRFAMDLNDEDSASRIDAIVEEMDELITEILEYSRYRHGLFDPNLEYTNVSELLKKSIGEFSDNPHIELTAGAGLHATEKTVYIDAALVKRCVTNLIHNAARYAKSKIYVDTVREADGWFSIVVEDDGPGVPPGKRRIIFEAFTRLDPSRSRSSGGTGLGLAIVEGITNKLNGEVSAGEGVVLPGARFVLRFRDFAVSANEG